MAIRECGKDDFSWILGAVNDAAAAYRGHVPEDCLGQPYMSDNELAGEILAGVRFHGYYERGQLLGVMGIQGARDVTLIRHAYVLTKYQGRGIGGKLIKHLIGLAKTDRVLVGTWAAASWAVRFYERHGFMLVTPDEKDRLLREYWTISDRQIETSVVLSKYISKDSPI